MSSLFDNLEEGAEFVNISCSVPVYLEISNTYDLTNYQLNYVRKKKDHKDEKLDKIYKDISKLKKEAQKLLNELNK